MGMPSLGRFAPTLENRVDISQNWADRGLRKLKYIADLLALNILSN